MKRYFFLIAFTIFFCAISFAQNIEWRELIENKQFEKVIEQTADMQPADSADFAKMFLLGQAYEGLLKYRAAYNCYKRCYELDSTRIDMLNTLARISGNIGKIKEAEKYYKQVVGYDSTNFYANYQLARLYVQQGKYSEGMKYYDYLLERDSENISLLRAKGDCYTRMDSLPAAAALYSSAFYKNVEDATLALTYANTLLNIGGPDNSLEALIACDTALIYNPEDRALRQKKAMIHFSYKEFQISDSIYTVLLEEQDSSYLTLKYSGCARYYSKKWFSAIDPLEKAFKKDTTALDICLLLGISLGRTYDTKQAFQYFEKAEQLMIPDDYWSNALVEFRAEMYAKTGDCDKSARLYYKLWKKDNDFSWLERAFFCYFTRRTSDMPDEEKQRFLFLCYLFAYEISENQEKLKRSSYLCSTLETFHEEMFFRGLNSYPMISPDNKKNTLPIEKLKALIEKFPERRR